MRKLAIIWVVFILINLSNESVFATSTTSDTSSVTVENSWQAIFPNATELGEKESTLPIWPVYQVGNLIGYLFESIDLIQIPGFSGEPVNLLIGIDTQGNFADVKLITHNEPIFLHGLGEEPLFRFIEQYKTLSTIDTIKVGKRKSGPIIYLDGITKATASVIVINETILLSALKIAKAKLDGFSATPIAEVITDKFTPKTWQEMLDSNYIKQISVSNHDIESAFNDTQVENIITDIIDETNDQFIDLYFAYLNVPTVGRNLLGKRDYERLMSELETGEQAIIVMSKGHYSFVGEDFIPASVPDRISLQQNQLPIDIRDMNFYDFEDIHSPYLTNFESYKLFKIKQQAEFDPGSSWTLSLIISLSRGQFFDAVSANFDSNYQLSKSFFFYPEIVEPSYTPPWMIIWENRIIEVIILLIALTILTAIIIFQHQLVRKRPLFRWIRASFLLFTLFFIGFYSQGQLSVVNVFTLIQSLLNKFSIEDFLIDPIIFILWIYVFISLILWGRGIFCGWLCPFGALQDALSWVAKKLRIKQITIPYKTHSRLWAIKYIAMVALAAISIYSLNTAEVFSEIEPFKTAITLVFIRTWPFVLYAVVLLVLGLFIHKFYCRYLCPLGAGLAMIGWLRRFEWLNRRAECGQPCQLCRNKCEIDAIKPTGEVDYNECIQCLECIVYYNADDLCAPKIIANKKSKKKKNNIIATTAYYTP